MDTNTPHGGHGHGDDTSGFVSPESMQRGHEPDKVDAKSILYVPIALVATFVLAYVVVTLIINYVRSPSTEPASNSAAAKRNEAPLNDRFARIDSSDPKADVKQPRLEGNQRVKTSRGDEKDAPYWRSMNPTPDGNPRWFHPEDMRNTSEYAKELGLQDYSWVDKDKKILRIPVTEAMKLVLEVKDAKNPGGVFLPVAKDPVPRGDLKVQTNTTNPQYGSAKPAAHDPHDPKKKDDKKH